jgi:hypothetical protein
MEGEDSVSGRSMCVRSEAHRKTFIYQRFVRSRSTISFELPAGTQLTKRNLQDVHVACISHK